MICSFRCCCPSFPLSFHCKLPTAFSRCPLDGRVTLGTFFGGGGGEDEFSVLHRTHDAADNCPGPAMVRGSASRLARISRNEQKSYLGIRLLSGKNLTYDPTHEKDVTCVRQHRCVPHVTFVTCKIMFSEPSCPSQGRSSHNYAYIFMQL